MRFYLSNEKLDNEIVEIKQKIKLSMNGVVADQMKESGIRYKQNFGVSVVRLREIAAEYSPDTDLAKRLWMSGIREAMILSTLLQPAGEMTQKDAKLLILEMDNSELVEQSTMNLLRKLSFAKDLVLDCMNSEEKWVIMTCFMLAVRVYTDFNTEELMKIVDAAVMNASNPEVNIYKTAALCLGRFCRRDPGIRDYVELALDNRLTGNTIAERYVLEEVKNEILFLSDL
ncbi:MAG: DNA alkylation repair protein [Paludibacter sp.]|nr:DNA alkylation repair protein [Paludibacter sp.]